MRSLWMTTPAELMQAPDNLEALAGAEDIHFDFIADPDPDRATLYSEIAERRARLENADILRGARAL
jgi:hypothetical protein